MTIIATGGYNAWPDSCSIPGGVLCVYTQASSHHLDNSGIAVCRERGLAWGPPVTVHQASPLWCTPMGVSYIDGRAFVSLWKDQWNVQGTGRAGLVWSDDRQTWSAWIDLHGPSGFTQESFAAGPVVKFGGAYYVTVEGTNLGDAFMAHTCRLLKSMDGLVWGDPVQIAAAPAYESRLVTTPTELLCLHRTADGPSTTTINWSADGLTWSAPVTAFAGHGAPKTTRLANGHLCAVTRRNSDQACIAYFSADNGRSWGLEVVIDATMFSMMYGCPVQIPGDILVQYGAQPTSSSYSADLREAVLLEPVPPAGSGTWNPLDKSSKVSLSNGNLTASETAGVGAVRSLTAHTSGHWQAEISVAGPDANHLVGVGTASASLAVFPGGDASGWAFYLHLAQKYNAMTASAYGVAGAALIGIEYDNGVLRFHRNGVDMGVAYTVTGAVFVMWAPGTSGAGTRSATANFNGPFAHPIPGAAAWG